MSCGDHSNLSQLPELARDTEDPGTPNSQDGGFTMVLMDSKNATKPVLVTELSPGGHHLQGGVGRCKVTRAQPDKRNLSNRL